MSSEPATTRDAFLGGRLLIRQPRKGHRAGIDAVLLAAACPAGPGEHVVDLGAGTGVAGLCVLARVPQTMATLVEIEPGAALLAGENCAANGMEARARVVEADLTAKGAAAACGFARPGADHVIANPPFEEIGRTRLSPVGGRALAHAADPGALDAWIRLATAIVKARGSFTLIHRAEALGSVLQGLSGRFGAIRVKPVQPRAGVAATRVIVGAVKGSRAPLTLLAPLVLHGAEGHGFCAEPESVLRHGEALAMG